MPAPRMRMEVVTVTSVYGSPSPATSEAARGFLALLLFAMSMSPRCHNYSTSGRAHCRSSESLRYFYHENLFDVEADVTWNEIREKFLQFFERNDHQRAPRVSC